MEAKLKEFESGLKKGLIDRNVPYTGTFEPLLLTNHDHKKQDVLSTLIDELRVAKSFKMAVAFVTKSGIQTLKTHLLDLQKRGIRGQLVTSTYNYFNQPEMFQELLKLNNVEVKIANKEAFHSKGYIFDHGHYQTLIVGSSNLTAGALKVNYEWNIKLTSFLHGSLIEHFTEQFHDMWEDSIPLTQVWITKYRDLYQTYSPPLVAEVSFNYPNKWKDAINIKPNDMQKQALLGIEAVRDKQEKRALIISATGTGKTYLAAFDVRNFKPKRLLFIVHREQILKKALADFRLVIGGSDDDYGILSGTNKKTDAKYLFATIQSLSKEETLQNFTREAFDYIIIDETHRAGATSYQAIIDHFSPSFMLGMTATPERTDGYDLFKLFDYNIAYEIRLQEALAEKFIVPFHYFGVTNYEIDGTTREDLAFSDLSTEEQVKHICEKLEYYGYDGNRPCGLIFCQTKKAARTLSDALNKTGLRTKSLTGDDKQSVREMTVKDLENGTLDYILTVDIFNEGIDIPKINQVVMLRQTDSSIIFIQQLGRGLRKAAQKSFLTVIDFIGNHENNYLIPVALYGDHSYNKDQLRKLLVERSNGIPGESTINFEQVALDRIFKAVDQKNMCLKKDLDDDYTQLKLKIGKVPTMMDFVKHSLRSPNNYISYSKSYYRYVKKHEKDLQELTDAADQSLFYLGQHVLNGIRIHEALLLQLLLHHDTVFEADFLSACGDDVYGTFTDEIRRSVLKNVNLQFYMENHQGKRQSPNAFLKLNFISFDDVSKSYTRTTCFNHLLKEPVFKAFLADHVDYALHVYHEKRKNSTVHEGFMLYQKYTRQDVFRLLLWDENPLAQNVGGYVISKDQTHCPIFVNYHKESDISDTTKYDDRFISPQLFQWISKSKRHLNSPDILSITNSQSKKMRLPLFIKKHNDEGLSFYYVGDTEPIVADFKEDTMPTEHKPVSIVKMPIKLLQPVEHRLYHYLTDDTI